ncbi:hypothetical protein ACIQMV_13130 [Streptomyces sp. NPDC091412]|uniref:hypothetical protein n=1 Tax=unclassified Streptomyces TaxID=2593676 RepID=UPI001143EA04|nr:hypothetical protein [Streptomyces sp. 6-11-2]GED87007.1 hypothetical protein TNCT6_40920 [Streptomyces sp. 6-11-2]
MRKRAATIGAALAGAALLFGATSASAAEAGAQALSCKTSAGNTGGWAECTGSGVWRAKAVCNFESDKYSQRVDQKSGTVRVYVPDCTFSIEKVVVELL